MTTNPTYKYTKSHEWVNFTQADRAYIGITDFAQNSLGEIVFVNLPVVSDAVNKGDTLTDVESVKAVADIYCPVSGVILNVNENLADNPGLLNESPYESWIAEIDGITDTAELMNAEEYEKFCAEQN